MSEQHCDRQRCFFFYYYLQFLLFHADFRVLLCSGQGRSQSLLPLALGPLWNRCSDRDGCLHDADGGVFWKVIQLWRTQRLWWDVHTAQDLNPFPRAFFFSYQVFGHLRLCVRLGRCRFWLDGAFHSFSRGNIRKLIFILTQMQTTVGAKHKKKEKKNEKNKQRKSLPVL